MTRTTRIQPEGTLANPTAAEGMTTQQQALVLVLGGTGKVGRRVADLLTARGVPVRIGARTAAPSFDWNNPATWTRALDGAQSVFISYAPDLTVPGAPQAVEAFTEQAAAQGVARIVLLSGRPPILAGEVALPVDTSPSPSSTATISPRSPPKRSSTTATPVSSMSSPGRGC
jgi:nucleoside-diphosphate-sugar epimerase